MTLLNVAAVSKLEKDVAVVNNVSFTQEQGRKLAIAGTTGSGKSNLLKMIAGLVMPTSGSILFGGEKVKGPDERLIPGHPGIAYLSQYFELRNHYRVKDFLSMASKVSETAADNIYQLCRIEPFLQRWTHQLSGGEKQRIALARLLLTVPKLLLLDEPFSNLDPFHKTILKAVIEELSTQSAVTCMLVSHDPMDTLSWADEILVLKNGELVQKAGPKEVYFNPVDEYTAALFGKYNQLTNALIKQFERFALSGSWNGGLVRPVKFKVGDEGQGVAGRILQNRFMGGYFEVDVLVEDQLLTLNSEKALDKGKMVYLRLEA